MLALYRKSESYLKNSREMLGDVGMEKNIRARIEHFRDVLSTLPQSVDDSDDIMQALNEDSGVFSADHRKELGKLLTEHMASKVSSRAEGNTKLQLNMYLYNYMPASVWDNIQDLQISWDDKLELGIEFLLQLRIHNPMDLTYKVLLAMLMQGHKKGLAPKDAFKEINKLKNKMVQKRIHHNTTQALLT